MFALKFPKKVIVVFHILSYLQVIFLKNVDIKSFSFLKNLPSHPKDSNTVSQSSKLNEKLLGQFIKN